MGARKIDKIKHYPYKSLAKNKNVGYNGVLKEIDE